MFCSRLCNNWDAATSEDTGLACTSVAPALGVRQQDAKGPSPLQDEQLADVCRLGSMCSSVQASPGWNGPDQGSVDECGSEDGGPGPDKEMQVHSRELRKLLDDWGERHMQVLKEALHGRSIRFLPTGQSQEWGAGRSTATSRSRINSRVKQSTTSSRSGRGSWLLPSALSKNVNFNLPSSLSEASGISNRSAANTETPAAVAGNQAHLQSQVTCTNAGRSRNSIESSNTHRSLDETEVSQSEQAKALPENLWQRLLRLTAKRPRLKVSQLCAALLDSTPCQLLCAAVIFANTLLISWISDQRMRNVRQVSSLPAWSVSAETAFTIFFAVEIGLRMVGHGMQFFCSVDRMWNLFDVMLVISRLSGASEWNVTFLRILRLFGMPRLLHLTRFLRSFYGLRLIVNSMRASLSMMFWAAALLLCVTFVFASILLDFVARCLQVSVVSVEEGDMLEKYWGTLCRSMYSLFLASTGGEDWNGMAEPLLGASRTAYVLFIAYLVFFLFILTGIVISLFVEVTLREAAHDHAMAIQYELEHKEDYVEGLSLIFRDLDVRHDGCVPHRLFLMSLRDSRMLFFLDRVGLDTYDATNVFRVLSGSCTVPVELETFVVCCIKLRGEVRALEMLASFQSAEYEKSASTIPGSVANL